MSVLGIVAEYNPPHNGHKKHIALAKERVNPAETNVILSPCFTQRGEMAMLSPWERARGALDMGADAVFMLPVRCVLRDAEHYAAAAVDRLAKTGVTHLAFGAENDDLKLLLRAAEATEGNKLRDALRKRLAEGTGYPRAMAEAAAEVMPEAAEVLGKPNNILAVCYLRAILRDHPEMEPVVIRRDGSYHAGNIDPENPGAGAVRAAVRSGDYGTAFSAVPEETERMIRRAALDRTFPDESRADILLREKWLTLGERRKELPDLSEGIEDRMDKAVRTRGTRAEMLDAACGRRYSRARMSRLLACAMTGIRADSPEPEEILLLGLRGEAHVWRQKAAKVISSLKQVEDLPEWAAEIESMRVWGECAGRDEGWFYREKVVRV